MVMLFANLILLCAWFGFGVAVMCMVDMYLKYELSIKLGRMLPAAVPRWTPQLLLSLFWPFGLVWAISRK